jgi:hypothetical protein
MKEHLNLNWGVDSHKIAVYYDRPRADFFPISDSKTRKDIFTLFKPKYLNLVDCEDAILCGNVRLLVSSTSKSIRFLLLRLDG